MSNQKFPYNDYATVESMEKVRGKGSKKPALQGKTKPNLTKFSLNKVSNTKFQSQQHGLGGLKVGVAGIKQRGKAVMGKLS